PGHPRRRIPGRSARVEPRPGRSKHRFIGGAGGRRGPPEATPRRHRHPGGSGEAMSRLTVSTEQRDGLVVIALKGEMDIAEADRLEQELLAQEREAPPLLVLDMRGLTFLDSTELRLVLEADVRARQAGRRLAIVPGPEVVHRVFLIAMLDKRRGCRDDPA